MKRLNDNEVLLICKEFIKSKGYPCKLLINDNIKKYLLMYGYIEISDYSKEHFILDKKFYKNYKSVIDKFGFNKIELILIENCSPFTVIYFDEELMHLFLNNPRFHFVWSGYRGYVCSADDSRLDIYIKDLCLCHDLEENKIVLGAFACDLISCSEQSQLLLQPFILNDDKRKFNFHYYNYKNIILGKWLEINELDIYTVILEGIKIVNYIFNEKYGFKLYKNEYETGELQFFMPLFYPTKINRFNFLMEVSKIFLDNINGKNLKKIIKDRYQNMNNKNDFSLEDLKKENFREFKIFKIYFGQYELFSNLSFEKLDKIRTLRTEPAHKIYNNDLNYSYCVEQDETLKSLYRILHNIIKVEDDGYTLLKKYENGRYYCFYGPKGGILENNGFNAKPFHYYDGYTRLINEKFDVRDAEILIAGNDATSIKNELVTRISNNYKIDKSIITNIVDYLMTETVCSPDENELKSFFYGQALFKHFHGKCKNYKKNGQKMYEQFYKNDYKYIYIFADSSELHWNIDDALEIIKNDKKRLFGSGFLLGGLSNNFSNDNLNIFNDNVSDKLLILNNVWD